MVEVKEVEKLGNLKETENLRFRRYLKMNADPDDVDRYFRKLHKKYFDNFDCSKCRNCCKKLGAAVEQWELNDICNSINIEQDEFIEKYLQENISSYQIKEKPCPFLKEDGICLLNSCLPMSCKKYPYTNEDDRLFSMLSVVQNSKICPVVYEILEELKKIYNFR